MINKYSIKGYNHTLEIKDQIERINFLGTSSNDIQRSDLNGIRKMHYDPTLWNLSDPLPLC